MSTVIVTGATRGIGKAIALKLTDLKFNVVLVGRNVKQLTILEDEIKQKGGECISVKADLSDKSSFGKIIKESYFQFGEIDVLINNAGLAQAGSIEDTDIATWDLLHAVNARAPFFLSKAAIPYLKKSNNPIIINISSVVGFKGYVNQAAYVSSKHALTGFTKVLAKEVQKDGIKVHLISPGGVNTEMIQEMRPDIDVEQLIQPEEIAELVEFLITRKGNGIVDQLYIRRKSGEAFDG